jgi:hypothetical protein
MMHLEDKVEKWLRDFRRSAHWTTQPDFEISIVHSLVEFIRQILREESKLQEPPDIAIKFNKVYFMASSGDIRDALIKYRGAIDNVTEAVHGGYLNKIAEAARFLDDAESVLYSTVGLKRMS